ncbi:MAG: helix-turn-helix domain-containing protein [Caldisericia bacterium]
MENLLSIQQTSEILGIGVGTLYQWTSQHRVPHYKIGRRVKFKATELEKWVEKKKVVKKEPHFPGID